MPSNEEVKFVLRLPEAMHRKIKKRASQNNTSMNKEIVNVLNEALGRATTDKMLSDLVKRLEKKKVI